MQNSSSHSSWLAFSPCPDPHLKGLLSPKATRRATWRPALGVPRPRRLGSEVAVLPPITADQAPGVFLRDLPPATAGQAPGVSLRVLPRVLEALGLGQALGTLGSPFKGPLMAISTQDSGYLRSTLTCRKTGELSILVVTHPRESDMYPVLGQPDNGRAQKSPLCGIKPLRWARSFSMDEILAATRMPRAARRALLPRIRSRGTASAMLATVPRP